MSAPRLPSGGEERVSQEFAGDHARLGEGVLAKSAFAKAIPRRITDGQAHARTKGQRSERPFGASPGRPHARRRQAGLSVRTFGSLRERTASCLVTV
jgi:hypothetical protein